MTEMPHTTILYKTTSEISENCYVQLRTKHNECKFMEETNDLSAAICELLHSVQETYLLFMCDDEVMYQKLDLLLYLEHLPRVLCLSLRHGNNITYDNMNNQSCGMPDDAEILPLSNGDICYRWNWEKGIAVFGYPYSVTATLYRTTDIIRKIDAVGTYGINTLEAQLNSLKYQLIYKEHDKYILSPRESVFFSTPYNIVQGIFPNNWVCSIHILDPNEANQRFLAGQELKVVPGRIYAAHQDEPYIWE